ncbi:hypothetical protein EYF80_046092 [Liparis tanakae]|uniref:Uncharacterized protein n=1 Tax=Liparis tanakae TaxID=230148 RepID=A0A4Z2FRC3_9TELE|nr:hypothetical protein EYF80_046092 [Liparis tanakae]
MFIRDVPTCEKHVDRPAGQGSEGAGAHAGVAPLHAAEAPARPGGGQQEEGPVGQTLQEVPPPRGKRPAVPKPGASLAPRLQSSSRGDPESNTTWLGPAPQLSSTDTGFAARVFRREREEEEEEEEGY